MNRVALFGCDRAQVVDRLANDVHYATERSTSDRDGNRTTLINRLHAAHHAVSGFHGDGSHSAFTQVLLHFENDVDRRGNVEAVTDDAQGLVNGRHRRLGELHVHSGTGDLNYVSDIFWHKSLFEL